mmetsp:Transcript_40510/g.129129  ORF Transcript_40510/g.129129 Transcript_40510/m.129129 type:complete len:248 (+) Transcript_40510:174-917(+)
MSPAKPAYTHGTPGSFFSSRPVLPTMSSTTMSTPATVMALPDPGRRTPTNFPASSYTVTCLGSRAMNEIPFLSPGSPVGRNEPHSRPELPSSLPSRDAIGSAKGDPSSGCICDPGALIVMAAMAQSVWYIVVPLYRRGSLTLIVLRRTSWPWGSITERSDVNCLTLPLGRYSISNLFTNTRASAAATVPPRGPSGFMAPPTKKAVPSGVIAVPRDASRTEPSAPNMTRTMLTWTPMGARRPASPLKP